MPAIVKAGDYSLGVFQVQAALEGGHLGLRGVVALSRDAGVAVGVAAAAAAALGLDLFLLLGIGVALGDLLVQVGEPTGHLGAQAGEVRIGGVHEAAGAGAGDAEVGILLGLVGVEDGHFVLLVRGWTNNTPHLVFCQALSAIYAAALAGELGGGASQGGRLIHQAGSKGVHGVQGLLAAGALAVHRQSRQEGRPRIDRGINRGGLGLRKVLILLGLGIPLPELLPTGDLGGEVIDVAADVADVSSGLGDCVGAEGSEAADVMDISVSDAHLADAGIGDIGLALTVLDFNGVGGVLTGLSAVHAVVALQGCDLVGFQGGEGDLHFVAHADVGGEEALSLLAGDLEGERLGTVALADDPAVAGPLVAVEGGLGGDDLPRVEAALAGALLAGGLLDGRGEAALLGAEGAGDLGLVGGEVVGGALPGVAGVGAAGRALLVALVQDFEVGGHCVLLE